MKGYLLDLDFGRWETLLLSILPSLVNIGIFFYVSIKLPQNRTNFSFSAFVLLGGLWQLCDGFVHLSISPETALEWYRMEVVFSLFVVPYGVLFTLSSSRWYKKVSNSLIFIVQFLPAIICLMLVLTRQDQYLISTSFHWFWIVNPKPTMATFFIYSWLALNTLIMLGLLWANFVKSNESQRNQSLLLAVGFTLPVIGGIMAEAIFPLVFNLDYLPITTPLITTFTIASFLAIKNNNLLDYSPRHQWGQIIESMNEGILIVDMEGRVMYANNMFCELLEYGFDEIKGEIAHELLIEDLEQRKYLENVIIERALGHSSQYELLLKTKSGKKVWFIINGTPYKDRRGKVIGSIGMHTNIDASKRAEARFKAIVENVGDIISLSDKDGNVIYDSPAIEKITGYSAEEMKGQPIYELMHPEQIDEAKVILRKVLDNPGVPYTRINRFRHKNGHYVWVEGMVTNLLENADVNAIVSSYHDVTERREAEQKIIQKDERLTAILDNEPECVKVVDLNGNLLEMNPAGLKMIEADSAAMVLGKNVIGLVYEEDKLLYQELHNRICKGETGTADFRIISLKGTQRWMESNSVPLKNAEGEIYATLSVARDITEIKKKSDELIGIKNRLEYSESRLKQAQAIARVGSWEYSLADNIALWSDEACRIFGLSSNENHLSIQEWLRYIHPDDLNNVVREIRNARATYRASSIQHRIVRKDGEVRFINSESRYDYDNEGKPIGLYGVVHDVTEEKLAELKLKNLLNVTNDQNNRLQNFAYIVSHNIRSHSANIIGIVNIFDKEKNENEKEKLFRMLQTSTNKLTETIENLNDIITIQNSTEMQKIRLNLRDEIEKTRHAINSILLGANAKFENLVPDNITVRFVPSYLESILLNVLTNAIKYRSAERELEIVVTVENLNDFILLSIKDNGLGIDLKKNREKIFGMYKTFHNNKDARGFGLYITKNQLEALGGKIEVESEFGKGSTFKIYINEEN